MHAASKAAAARMIAAVNHIVNRNDDAIAALNRALAAIDRLRRDFPSDGEHLRTLAGFWKGHRLASDGTVPPQDPQAAFETINRVATTWQALATQFPDVVAFQSDLAAIDLHIGKLVSGTGHASESIKYFELSRSLLEPLAREYPEALEYQADLARAHQNLSTVLFQLKRLDECVAAGRQALALREQLVLKAPHIFQYRDNLSISLFLLASRDQHRDPAGSEHLMRRAMELSREGINDRNPRSEASCSGECRGGFAFSTLPHPPTRIRRIPCPPLPSVRIGSRDLVNGVPASGL